ncbi:MAG TPA: tRNA lysidine(34) synthetase TilS [Candidatus Binataceae bacterium]|nr:tRNA lysidine(34) synthetase TilS [Candidatus Binataceae bacterium]
MAASGDAAKVAGTSRAEARRAIVRLERAIEVALRRAGVSQGDLLVVALSGGPDSVATLHGLIRINRRSGAYRVAAAHLNHRIRGAEADRDESFVRELCARLEIELIAERASGLRAKSPNLEERARELRYLFLTRTADRLGARFVVLGHHADDQAETVLLRLLRGSGAAGLAAMAAAGPEPLLRPLLGLRRRDITAYLAAIDADYVTDSSNQDNRRMRNRVRRSLLPGLERDYAPGLGRRLVELAGEMRELEGYITADARRVLEARLSGVSASPAATGWQIDVSGFGTLAPALGKAVLRELTRKGAGDLRRISRAHIAAMYSLATGVDPSAAVSLPGGWKARRENQTLILEHHTGSSRAEPFSITLKLGDNVIPGAGLVLTLEHLEPGDPGFPTEPWRPPSQAEAYFDAATAPVLRARSFRPADQIEPLGMNGSRKVQDVFVDRKLAFVKRSLWPLVVSEGAILWIPGLLRSRFALISAATKKVLHLRVKSPLQGEKTLIA